MPYSARIGIFREDSRLIVADQLLAIRFGKGADQAGGIEPKGHGARLGDRHSVTTQVETFAILVIGDQSIMLLPSAQIFTLSLGIIDQEQHRDHHTKNH